MEVSLNQKQREAVEHTHGPLLVLAGAGTGKTTVLVERVVRLIAEGHARAEEILAVTFTVNAASELQERVQKRLGAAKARGLRADTFHAVGNSVLRGRGKGFRLLFREDLWVFLRRRLRELPLERFLRAARPGEFLDHLITFFDRCLEDRVDAAAYEGYVARLRTGELPLPRIAMPRDADRISDEEVLARCEEIARVYRKVEEMLAAENLGLFGHMVSRAVELLEKEPRLLAEERQKARFILIDEFQDTNVAQIELAQLLGGEQKNVCAVGDPDQAIYRFRGASSAAFEEFLRRFPGARVLPLEENQRSTQTILDCAFAAIQRNPAPLRASGATLEFIREPLRSAREGRARMAAETWREAPVEIVLSPSPQHEAHEVVRTIAERKRKLNCRWRDFAVLYRIVSHRNALVAEFEAQQVPVAVEGVDVLDTSEVRDLLAILRAAEIPQDSVSLLRVAALPHFGLEGPRVRKELAAAKKPDLQAILKAQPGGAEILAALDDVRRKAASGTPLPELIDFALKRFHLATDAEPVRAFRDFVQQWTEKPITGAGTLAEFLEYLGYFVEAGGKVTTTLGDGGDAVRLMTVHLAKGLEFDHVYVIRVTSNSFPVGYRAPLFEFPRELSRAHAPVPLEGKELHHEEELRIFYVAATRAKNSLVLFGPQMGGGKKVPAQYLRRLHEDRSIRHRLQLRHAREMQVDLFGQAAAASAIEPWIELPPRMPLAEAALSASAIETYRRCPLRFKIERDWNLPGEPAPAMEYGAAVHTVLKDFYNSVRSGMPPVREWVLDRFREELGKAKLEDALQRELYERQGVEQLTRFFDQAAVQPLPDVLDTERTFHIELDGVAVTGRVDRVDRITGRRIRIVDYKTGSPRSQEDADDSLQLSIYALAAARAWELEPEEIVFYNLETNAGVVTSRDADALEAAVEEIHEAAEGIAAGNFRAKPGFHCKWCPYRAVCPATEERLFRAEAVASAGVQ
ncbi:MAG TPA: ATP-dependent DNA helicase [Terriglobales bacterium]|nr:ATP-dependent DNA helicase [Terriglobales bacterium]